MSLARSQDTRLICKNKLYFYILAMNNWILKTNVPFTVALKSVKYTGINLGKYVQDLYVWGKQHPAKHY